MSQPLILQTKTHADHDIVEQAEALLRVGALIVLPTDTVYGLAGCARGPHSADVEARIYQAKGRPENKPIPLLVSDVNAAISFGATLSAPERRLADAFWPGPLTLILNVGEKTEGFRMPAHALTCQVIAAAGGALRVTSANRSGEPEARTSDEARHALGSAVALIIDDGPSKGGTASSVVRYEQGELRVIREGALSRKTLEAVL